jgi:PAS domain S-box-containing protein
MAEDLVSQQIVKKERSAVAPPAKILLVDDQRANLLALRSMLEDLGEVLVEATSGEEAITRVKEHDFAVILLDVQMPGLDGFETAQRIRAAIPSRSTPIIFMTSYDEDRPSLERAYTLGAVDYLLKPITPLVLRAKVTGFVELYKERERASRSANQLRLLIEGTTEYAIFMLDPNGNVVTWNPGAERIKGYCAEEIIGQHFSVFYPEEAKQRKWPEHELKVASATGRFEDEGWRVRRDGTTFWANVVITALHDEAGNLVGFAKITRDLSERKRAEENAVRLAAEEAARKAAQAQAEIIEQQREQLEVTLASIGDGVISTDSDGVVTFLNPIAEQLTGWSQSEARGKPLVEIFTIVNEQTRQTVENPALRALREGTIVGLANHTVLISKDGTERPIDDSAAPIRRCDGGLLGVVLVFRDVTQRRRAEEALRASEARKAAILEAAMDCVISIDSAGTIIDFNPAAEKTFGFRREEVLGRELAETIIPPALREGHRQGFARFLETGESRVLDRRLEMPALHADGHEFPVELAITQIHTSAAPQFTAYLRGIESRMRQEQLRAVRLAISQVLAEATSASKAAQGILHAVCDGLDWDLGFYWIVDRETNTLRCAQSWHKIGATVSEFENSSRKATFVRSAGLPGRLWETGKPAWIADLARDSDSLRWQPAIQEGLQSAFGCPIIADNRTLGVLEFFGHQRRDVNADLLEMMGAASGQIGQFIERSRAQEEIQLQARLLDSVGQAVIVFDDDGAIIYWNRFAETLFGWAANEALGHSILDVLVPATERDKVAGLFDKHRTGETFSGEMLLERRGQKPFPALVTQTPIFGDDKMLKAVIGVYSDNTERQRLEYSLRFLADASATLAALVDYESTLQQVAQLAVPDFADWCAIDLAAANENLERVAVGHIDPAKVELAKEYHRRYPPDPRAGRGILHAFRTGRSDMMAEVSETSMLERAVDEEHRRMLKEIGVRSYICVPLRGRTQTLGVVTFVMAESGRLYNQSDLEFAEELARRAAIAIENAQLYADLREADRRKDEFLATLAHELRNPLAPIRNALEIQKLPGIDSTTVDETRDVMERQFQQLVRLVDDLLDVSRVMRGKIELRLEQVDLATIVARAIETARPLIEAQEHGLKIELAEPLLVNADPVRLAQVMGNLLTNAAKYTERGGQISLTAKRDRNQAVLTLRDNGIGIAPEMLAQIFELFVQADHSPTRSQGGLGIGLTLVKNLVDMHGGAVSAHSEGLGKGSEFVVRLPLVAPTAKRAEVMGPRPSNSAAAGFRLLIVDDNEDAANSLAVLLRLQGHMVQVVHNGPDAIFAAAEFRPDAILLDIGMPGMDGYEVARQIRQRSELAGVVIAALTGWGQEEDRRRTKAAGFDYHLVKPLDPKALDDLLAKLAIAKH